jgi:excisionase family DNA binding protein
MSQFLSLEEAARRLGISTERMVDLRSEGKIRGFRDGSSWKFPENELDRLADELANDSGDYNPYQGFDSEGDQDSDDLSASAGGSGVLVDELDLGSSVGSRSGSVIGSDVDLVPSNDGSDVKVVSGNTPSPEDSDDFMLSGGVGGLVEIDSGELQLSEDEPVISHDSEVLDLAIEPNAGSTGPITDKELKEVARANPDLMVGKKPGPGDSGLAFDDDDDDSGDDLIGVSSENDMLDSGLDFGAGVGKRPSGASSLELMDDLDLIGGSDSLSAGRSSRGVDVLSELDLLSADAGGSGLITGDSGNLLGSSDLGSGLGLGSGSGKGKGSNKLDFDDALADDDELVIADDEDDLVLGGSASDVSVSGDSGINLMSPSDSGLSLESEPLDLAGSSISALDLGAEIGSGIGSGSGLSGPARSGRGSGLNLQADEDFRLSPSGIGFDGDGESNSQVIEIEDSSAFVEEDAFGDAQFDDAAPLDAGFGDDANAQSDAFGDEAVAVDDDMPVGASRGRGAVASYEVPFTIFQVSMLMMTLMIMCLGGMLMTDLLRNMWAYTDTSAPVSSLTDALISLTNLEG